MGMGKQIFVVGNSRSGTTMMGRILGKHRDVFTFHELHFFEQLWPVHLNPDELGDADATKIVAQLLTIQRDGYYTQKKLTSYLAEARAILSSIELPLTAPNLFSTFLCYEAKLNNGTIPCDQTPRNVYYLNELFTFYPEAYVINMIRDPRDVLLSQKNKWKRSALGGQNIPKRELFRFWINYHPVTMSLMWKSGIDAAKKVGDHPRLINIRFEDLLLNPEAKVQKICAFLDLAYEPAILSVPQVGSSHRVDTAERTGLNQEAVARWQRSSKDQSDLYICECLTRPLLNFYQYIEGEYRPNLFILLLLGITWPIKLGLAFLLNLGRFRSFGNTFRKRLGLFSTHSKSSQEVTKP